VAETQLNVPLCEFLENSGYYSYRKLIPTFSIFRGTHCGREGASRKWGHAPLPALSPLSAALVLNSYSIARCRHRRIMAQASKINGLY